MYQDQQQCRDQVRHFFFEKGYILCLGKIINEYLVERKKGEKNASEMGEMH